MDVARGPSRLRRTAGCSTLGARCTDYAGSFGYAICQTPSIRDEWRRTTLCVGHFEGCSPLSYWCFRIKMPVFSNLQRALTVCRLSPDGCAGLALYVFPRMQFASLLLPHSARSVHYHTPERGPWRARRGIGVLAIGSNPWVHGMRRYSIS